MDAKSKQWCRPTDAPVYRFVSLQGRFGTNFRLVRRRLLDAIDRDEIEACSRRCDSVLSNFHRMNLLERPSGSG